VNFTVSNIAWSNSFDELAFEKLASLDVAALEIAPTRLWPDWTGQSMESAAAYRKQYQSRGMQIPSLQAILFGKPDYKLFGAVGQRNNLVSHLCLCADIAESLGARRLVFGAPKNRDRSGLSDEEAFNIAVDSFAVVGDFYSKKGLILCLEANPTQYGCNFLTNSQQAARLVRTVHSPGVGLHLDTACMHLAGENISNSIHENADILCHFHVSEPNLNHFNEPVIDHASVAATLREIGYKHWISLEMREAEPVMANLESAVRFVSSTYGFGL
jgi:D-psicose/D-tagatose/L-ribulose 3-epimerase